MIRNHSVICPLYKTEKTQLDFGEEEKDILIDNIEVAIFEKSVTDYRQKNADNIKYDYIGLSAYSNIPKNSFIISDTKKYKVKFVQHSKRYNTIFLERIE